MKRILWIGLSSIFLFTPVFASHRHIHSHDHSSCIDSLGRLAKPAIRIFNSGQDMGGYSKFEKAAHNIYDTAQKLGYSIPPMIIKSLSAGDMAALIANVGHPVPHWHDGLSILQMAGNAGSYLEFVETGRDNHVQFLRDTNSFEETLIVFAHVAGHYDFGVNSFLRLQRDPDRVRDSWTLSERVRKYSQEYDYLTVSQFYQYLLSAQYLQDIARGSYDSPESFEPQPVDKKLILEPTRDVLGRPSHIIKQPNNKHPRSPSPSVLQAFVRNLSPTAPAWQKEIIADFEQLHKATPTIMHTKIMNEGWATLAEYLVLRHTEYNTYANEFEFAKINAGVNVPSLSNPYWLGLQAWLRLRERFFDEHSEYKKLSPFEQDQKFVAYAKEIIKTYTDYSFLRLALDRKWVETWNLLLYREKGAQDPGGNSWWGPKKNIAITRDPRRVVEYIAHKQSNFDLKFPIIEINDFNLEEKGVVQLVHRPRLDIPLSRGSIAKTLLIYSRLFGRPVALDTIGSSEWFRVKKQPEYDYLLAIGAVQPKPQLSIDNFPMRVTVSPDGSVKVEALNEVKDETVLNDYIPQLQGELQAHSDLFNFELSVGEVANDLPGSEKMQALIHKIVALKSPGETIPQVVGHAPSGSDAVFKFFQFSSDRAQQIIGLAASGKWPIKFSKDGRFVNLKVLPEIPMFELDRRLQKIRKTKIQPTPPDLRFKTAAINEDNFADLLNEYDSPASLKVAGFQSLPDEDLDIGTGPYLPGDEWDKPPQQSGQGDGEGEDGEEGEEGEPGEGAGDQAGGGSQDDPSVVKIPINLFGELLAEQIKLRNLRKTADGENPEMEDIRFGGLRTPNGLIREDRMAESYLEKGITILKSQGKDPAQIPPDEIIVIGMMYSTPDDHIVYGSEQIPLPDIDAVVVYVADTSGSMGIEHRKIERQMVAYTSAVLKTIYPNLKEKFVIYDSRSEEVSREEFFSRSLGGGTLAQAGLDKTDEVLKKFPRSKYNRFVMLFSDGDDGDPTKATEIVKNWGKNIEFFAYGHVQPTSGGWSFGGGGVLSQAFKQLSETQKDRIGYADLTDLHASLLKALSIYFGTESPK